MFENTVAEWTKMKLTEFDIKSGFFNGPVEIRPSLYSPKLPHDTGMHFGEFKLRRIEVVYESRLYSRFAKAPQSD